MREWAAHTGRSRAGLQAFSVNIFAKVGVAAALGAITSRRDIRTKVDPPDRSRQSDQGILKYTQFLPEYFKSVTKSIFEKCSSIACLQPGKSP